MKMNDVTCSACEAGFRRVEFTFEPGAKGEYQCPVWGEVPEKFDGSALVAYRLTIQPRTSLRDASEFAAG
jgi:hypothetical protein